MAENEFDRLVRENHKSALEALKHTPDNSAERRFVEVLISAAETYMKARGLEPPLDQSGVFATDEA